MAFSWKGPCVAAYSTSQLWSRLTEQTDNFNSEPRSVVFLLIMMGRLAG